MMMMMMSFSHVSPLAILELYKRQVTGPQTPSEHPPLAARLSCADAHFRVVRPEPHPGGAKQQISPSTWKWRRNAIVLTYLVLQVFFIRKTVNLKSCVLEFLNMPKNKQKNSSLDFWSCGASSLWNHKLKIQRRQNAHDLKKILQKLSWLFQLKQLVLQRIMDTWKSEIVVWMCVYKYIIYIQVMKLTSLNFFDHRFIVRGTMILPDEWSVLMNSNTNKSLIYE